MRDSWKVHTIEDSCDILDNIRIPLNGEQRAKIPGSIPYYGANGAQGYISKYLFNEDLILLAEDGGNFEEYSTRPIAYKISGKSWVNNHAHILRAKKGFNQEFIFYSIVHKNIIPFIKGGTRSKLNLSDLKSVEVSYPPPLEQGKIASILSTCEEVIKQTEIAIAKYQALKQGMMHDLFTRGIDINTGKLRPTYQDAPDLYKASELGMIPKDWEMKKLENLTTYVDYRGKTPPKSDKGIFLVTAKNIKHGFIDFETSKEYIPEAAYKSAMSRGIPEIGDVLITTEAPMGNVAQISIEGFALAQRVIKYRCLPHEMLNDFLKHSMMSTYFQKELEAESTGSTVKGIKGSRLHLLHIFKPNIQEQGNIVQGLAPLENKIQTEQSALAKYQQLKAGLMHDLLTGQKEVIVDSE